MSADKEAVKNIPVKLAKIIKDGEYCANQVINTDDCFGRKCLAVLTSHTSLSKKQVGRKQQKIK